MEQFVLEALKAAPALVVSIAGIFFISKLFLSSWQKSEERRQIITDERHRAYFEQQSKIGDSMTKAVDRGTNALNENNKVLGSIAELMRDIKQNQD